MTANGTPIRLIVTYREAKHPTRAGDVAPRPILVGRIVLSSGENLRIEFTEAKAA